MIESISEMFESKTDGIKQSKSQEVAMNNIHFSSHFPETQNRSKDTPKSVCTYTESPCTKTELKTEKVNTVNEIQKKVPENSMVIKPGHICKESGSPKKIRDHEYAEMNQKFNLRKQTKRLNGKESGKISILNNNVDLRTPKTLLLGSHTQENGVNRITELGSPVAMQKISTSDQLVEPKSKPSQVIPSLLPLRNMKRILLHKVVKVGTKQLESSKVNIRKEVSRVDACDLPKKSQLNQNDLAKLNDRNGNAHQPMKLNINLSKPLDKNSNKERRNKVAQTRELESCGNNSLLNKVSQMRELESCGSSSSLDLMKFVFPVTPDRFEPHTPTTEPDTNSHIQPVTTENERTSLGDPTNYANSDDNRSCQVTCDKPVNRSRNFSISTIDHNYSQNIAVESRIVSSTKNIFSPMSSTTSSFPGTNRTSSNNPNILNNPVINSGEISHSSESEDFSAIKITLNYILDSVTKNLDSLNTITSQTSTKICETLQSPDINKKEQPLEVTQALGEIESGDKESEKKNFAQNEVTSTSKRSLGICKVSGHTSEELQISEGRDNNTNKRKSKSVVKTVNKVVGKILDEINAKQLEENNTNQSDSSKSTTDNFLVEQPVKGKDPTPNTPTFLSSTSNETTGKKVTKEVKGRLEDSEEITKTDQKLKVAVDGQGEREEITSDNLESCPLEKSEIKADILTPDISKTVAEKDFIGKDNFKSNSENLDLNVSPIAHNKTSDIGKDHFASNPENSNQNQSAAAHSKTLLSKVEEKSNMKNNVDCKSHKIDSTDKPSKADYPGHEHIQNIVSETMNIILTKVTEMNCDSNHCGTQESSEAPKTISLRKLSSVCTDSPPNLVAQSPNSLSKNFSLKDSVWVRFEQCTGIPVLPKSRKNKIVNENENIPSKKLKKNESKPQIKQATKILSINPEVATPIKVISVSVPSSGDQRTVKKLEFKNGVSSVIGLKVEAVPWLNTHQGIKLSAKGAEGSDKRPQTELPKEDRKDMSDVVDKGPHSKGEGDLEKVGSLKEAADLNTQVGCLKPLSNSKEKSPMGVSPTVTPNSPPNNENADKNPEVGETLTPKNKSRRSRRKSTPIKYNPRSEDKDPGVGEPMAPEIESRRSKRKSTPIKYDPQSKKPRMFLTQKQLRNYSLKRQTMGEVKGRSSVKGSPTKNNEPIDHKVATKSPVKKQKTVMEKPVSNPVLEVIPKLSTQINSQEKCLSPSKMKTAESAKNLTPSSGRLVNKQTKKNIIPGKKSVPVTSVVRTCTVKLKKCGGKLLCDLTNENKGNSPEKSKNMKRSKAVTNDACKKNKPAAGIVSKVSVGGLENSPDGNRKNLKIRFTPKLSNVLMTFDPSVTTCCFCHLPANHLLGIGDLFGPYRPLAEELMSRHDSVNEHLKVPPMGTVENEAHSAKGSPQVTIDRDDGTGFLTARVEKDDCQVEGSNVCDVTKAISRSSHRVRTLQTLDHLLQDSSNRSWQNKQKVIRSQGQGSSVRIPGPRGECRLLPSPQFDSKNEKLSDNKNGVKKSPAKAPLPNINSIVFLEPQINLPHSTGALPTSPVRSSPTFKHTSPTQGSVAPKFRTIKRVRHKQGGVRPMTPQKSPNFPPGTVSYSKSPDCTSVDVSHRFSTGPIWTHGYCALWADGVYAIRGQLYGLWDASRSAGQVCCVSCRKTGATISCRGENDRGRFSGSGLKAYHYPCALIEGLKLNWDTLTAVRLNQE